MSVCGSSLSFIQKNLFTNRANFLYISTGCSSAEDLAAASRHAHFETSESSAFPPPVPSEQIMQRNARAVRELLVPGEGRAASPQATPSLRVGTWTCPVFAQRLCRAYLNQGCSLREKHGCLKNCLLEKLLVSVGLISVFILANVWQFVSVLCNSWGFHDHELNRNQTCKGVISVPSTSVKNPFTLFSDARA